ncbi:TPA: hypothetical protein ACFP4Y_001479 [Neisseria bacilliformis]
MFGSKWPHPAKPKNRVRGCATHPTSRQRPSEKTKSAFQTASSPSTHAEPDVGCVAPRRRTRFPLFKGRLKILKPDFQTTS